MYHSLKIKNKEGKTQYYSLNFWGIPDSKRIEVRDVCIIDIYKLHDHRYDLKAFFYEKKHITYQKNIRSKKELYSAIQKLLQENLYQAVQ